ncbi:hypothetical protein [Lachnospira intestinalis]|uniref:Uncharacterized protein n=1 Tax=Lachnospira intestinalis TaxID=3133158 RepID=A0ABV1H573_9FIRM
MIVEEHHIGKTTIYIDDSCVRYKTPEDAKPVMERIYRIYKESEIRKMLKEQEK